MALTYQDKWRKLNKQVKGVGEASILNSKSEFNGSYVSRLLVDIEDKGTKKNRLKNDKEEHKSLEERETRDRELAEIRGKAKKED